jgi:hypothetical protein
MEQGITLIGKAAEAYVQFKYVEMITNNVIGLVVFAIICFGLYKFIKFVFSNL